MERILERHAPRWLGTSAIALDSRFAEEAVDVLRDVNLAMVQAADAGPEPSRTTLSLALVRPSDGFAAALSVGDSHVLRLGECGAEEWIPQAGGRSLYLGEPGHDVDRLSQGVRVEVGDMLPSSAYAERLERVPPAWAKAFEVNAADHAGVRASCIEFVLAGLYATDRISRAQRHGRIEYEL